MASPFPRIPTLAQVLSAGSNGGAQDTTNLGSMNVADGHGIATPSIGTDEIAGHATSNISVDAILDFVAGQGVKELGNFDVASNLLGGSPTSPTPTNYLTVTNGATTYFIPLLPST